jgi:hypothetical protein
VGRVAVADADCRTRARVGQTRRVARDLDASEVRCYESAGVESGQQGVRPLRPYCQA